MDHVDGNANRRIISGDKFTTTEYHPSEANMLAAVKDGKRDRMHNTSRLIDNMAFNLCHRINFNKELLTFYGGRCACGY
jgi:hypothetical protein